MTTQPKSDRCEKSRTARDSCVCKYFVVVGLFVAFLAHTTTGLSRKNERRQTGGRAQKKLHLSRQEVKAAEQKLAELGYWTGKADGKLDSASRYAVTAFQKVEGRKRTGKLTRKDYEAILFASPPLPRESHYAHVEVDLKRQILLRVDSAGKVSHILPISTGNGELFDVDGYAGKAVTPSGKFTVYDKIEGWRKSPLGVLYYPNYIVGGIAIHGSPSVPVQPASHGCIRIPMVAAEEFSRLTPIGTIVVVHTGKQWQAESTAKGVLEPR